MDIERDRDISEKHAGSAGWADLLKGRNGALSLALAGGVMLHAINVYVTITILPSVVEEIGGASFYAWNTTLFILASIVGSVLSSNILSRSGPVVSYRLAVIVFLIGATICAIAPSMPVLLFGRAVQGLGGGVLFALSYAMIQIVFREALWSRAMALVSSMWGAATLAGPALGGVFAELDMWRGAFWGIVIVSLPYLLLTERILPKRYQASGGSGSIAWLQIALLSLAVLAISVASLTPELSVNMAGLALAIALTLALIMQERRATHRLLPKGSFSFSHPLASLYLVMALLVIGMQTEIYVPYFLQALHGATPLIAGYLAALMAAGWAVSAILFSGASGAGARSAVVIGPILVAVSLAVLAPLLAGRISSGLVPIGVALTLVGFGIGLAWPHLLARILIVAPKDEAEKTSSGITTLQLFATAFGASLAGMVANASGFDGSAAGQNADNAAFWVFVLFTIAPLIAILAAIGAAREMRRSESTK